MTKILVVGPSWVGDMVMAQSLFIRLQALHADLELQVLAPAWSLPLLARMPEVHAGIEMPIGHGSLNWSLRRRIGRDLISEHFDQAILLPNSLKSALIPFWAKIPLRTGWKGEMRYGLLNDLRHLDKQLLYKTVERFVALADPTDIQKVPDIPRPRLNIDPITVEQTRNKFELNENLPVLALCPGAEYGMAKRWPERHFASLANVYLEKGWQVWLFGSEKDQTVCSSIMRMTEQQAKDLSGNTTLAECIDLLSQASAVVSNDSGLMHVAAALGRPLIALYGSSDPVFTPPLSNTSDILDLNLDCSPCFKRECPLEHLNCLVNITPDQVKISLDELIR